LDHTGGFNPCLGHGRVEDREDALAQLERQFAERLPRSEVGGGGDPKKDVVGVGVVGNVTGARGLECNEALGVEQRRVAQGGGVRREVYLQVHRSGFLPDRERPERALLALGVARLDKDRAIEPLPARHVNEVDFVGRAVQSSIEGRGGDCVQVIRGEATEAAELGVARTERVDRPHDQGPQGGEWRRGWGRGRG